MSAATPSIEPGKPTPMLAQYLALKKEAREALLFFRLGDFYELFLEDAVTAAEELDLVLTTRGKLEGAPVPMCGVPFHAYESYVARLVEAGYTVAVAEQMEDPRNRAEKGPVRRAITRVLTAGTLTEERLLPAGQANWLLATFPREKEVGLAWCDISTGSFHMATVPAAALTDEIARLGPAEIISPTAPDAIGKQLPRPLFRSENATRALCERFAVASLAGFGDFGRPALAAAAGLLSYIEETARGGPIYLAPPVAHQPHDTMAIDAASRNNLEILAGANGRKVGSLYATINRTVSAGGARLLASELAAPLTARAEISSRLDMVDWFLGDDALRERVRQHLKQAPDLSRALGRILAGRESPRDFAAIKRALQEGEALALTLQEGMEGGAPAPLTGLHGNLGEGAELLLLLERMLAESLPLQVADGGVIRAGHDAELDRLRALAADSRSAIAALEQKLRTETGIPPLKIRFNNVLGYHIDVPSRYAEQLRGDTRFTHRQTLASSTRFDTAGLRTLASQILDAREEALAREAEHVATLVASINAGQHTLSRLAVTLAALDRSSALAELAGDGGWCRPQLTDGMEFHIVQGRHPVVEQALVQAGGVFVPNDCTLEGEERLWLVTGPNMGGKSTFLRQNALFAILAQAGSFVPATEATIGIVDRITCRVGASDNLAEGRSTFMVEMVETAALLRTATQHSLLLLDEVGRGTATWDGLALAWAILENIHDKVAARCLFATHYHELSTLKQRLRHLALRNMRVREWKGDLLFLHEVGEGAATSSFGLQVARLAGVPEEVIARAADILKRLEAGDITGNARNLLEGLPLFAPHKAPPESKDPLREKLRALEPDSLSPRTALALLYELVALAEEKPEG